MKLLLDAELALILGITQRVKTLAALLSGAGNLHASVDGAHVSDTPPKDYVQLVFAMVDDQERIGSSVEVEFLQTHNDRFTGSVCFMDRHGERFENDYEIDIPKPEFVDELCDIFAKIIHEYFVDGQRPPSLKYVLAGFC